MNKRGQAVTLGNAPQLVLLLALTILIVSASAIALGSFKQTQCSTYWDGVACYNNASKNYLYEGTATYNVTQNGELGLDNFATQVPTIGTVIGVALIIVVVIGAFAFFGNRGGL